MRRNSQCFKEIFCNDHSGEFLSLRYTARDKVPPKRPCKSAETMGLAFAGSLVTTAGSARPPPRFLGCHPFCDVFLGCPVEVIEQLAVQFLVHLRPAKQRPQPQGNREQPMLRSHSPTLLY